jgi:DNA-binding NarL/FixJ family response regulator
VRQRVFTVVAVRAWAQLLDDQIERMPEFEVVGSAPEGAVALNQLEQIDPPATIVVLDVGTRLALQAASALHQSDATKRLVAVGLDEDPSQAIAWAMVGAAALVGCTASLDELLRTLNEVAVGEAHCSAGVSGALLQAIGGKNGVPRATRNTMPLTGREQEVAWLVASGLTNSEIATRLQIAPGTVKSHVHNVIRKLGVARRAYVARKLPDDNRPPLFTADDPTLSAVGGVATLLPRRAGTV